MGCAVAPLPRALRAVRLPAEAAEPRVAVPVDFLSLVRADGCVAEEETCTETSDEQVKGCEAKRVSQPAIEIGPALELAAASLQDLICWLSLASSSLCHSRLRLPDSQK